jgi:hypothetical protein
VSPMMFSTASVIFGTASGVPRMTPQSIIT